MRVCHLTSAHPRHDVRICEKECVTLAKNGFETYLIVNDDLEDEDYKGVHIISTGKKHSSRISRMVDGPRMVLKKALDTKADIYHFHDPELLTFSARLLKTGSKVIFDMHEDTEKQISTKYWIPRFLRSGLSFGYGVYSHRIFRKLSGLITVTPSFVEKLRQYNSQVILVTNYPILDSDPDHKQGAPIVSDGDQPYVFFAGGISEQWCHESIAEAVKRVPEIKYKFAGKGDREYIDRIVHIGGDHVEYLGLLPHDQVSDYYCGSVAGVALNYNYTQVGKEGTLGNTKLFEVMQSGKPVICSDFKLWREIIEENHCGICVDPDHQEELIKALRFIVDNPDQAADMGKNGARIIREKYNWNTQVQELLKFYESICESEAE